MLGYRVNEHSRVFAGRIRDSLEGRGVGEIGMGSLKASE